MVPIPAAPKPSTDAICGPFAPDPCTHAPLAEHAMLASHEALFTQGIAQRFSRQIFPDAQSAEATQAAPVVMGGAPKQPANSSKKGDRSKDCFTNDSRVFSREAS